MKTYATISIALGLFGPASAGQYHPSNAKCVDYTIPISVSTQVLVWNSSKWEDNYSLTDFVSLAATRASANYPVPFGGLADYNGSFEISATFCSPKNSQGKTVILASHGLGFTRGFVAFSSRRIASLTPFA
jgi:hypothetical protein